jgi:hypothetical protein
LTWRGCGNYPVISGTEIITGFIVPAEIVRTFQQRSMIVILELETTLIEAVLISVGSSQTAEGL